ncbi:hypothetical protein [Bacillus horti]|uniref:Uncharacterized protein n=1 Tax=Caldalkalibacillus horti TaxID=77523 RepID=A0ABT9VV23_9BACI|nr:hypothetical protein [Bacillus horti]
MNVQLLSKTTYPMEQTVVFHVFLLPIVWNGIKVVKGMSENLTHYFGSISDTTKKAEQCPTFAVYLLFIL